MDYLATLNVLNQTAQTINDVANSNAQRKHEASESEKAREHDVNMLDYENEYNLPVNQINRLREAGINPAAVYGTVAKNNTTETSHMQYHRTPFVPNQFTPIDVLGIAHSIENLNSQRLSNKEKEFNLGRQNQLLNYQIEAARLDNVLRAEDVRNKYKLSAQQLKNLMQQYKFNDEVNQHRLDNWRTFGSEEAPWYLKFAAQFLEAISNNPTIKLNLF